MADAHEEAVSQTQSYKDAVSFFLEGDDKAKEQHKAGVEAAGEVIPGAEAETGDHDTPVEAGDESTEGAGKDIELYKPRPTLKEIAATRSSFNQTLCPPDETVGGIRRAASFGGYDNVRAKQTKQESRSVSDVPVSETNADASTSVVTVKDKVMDRFSERENMFLKSFEQSVIVSDRSERQTDIREDDKKLSYFTGDGLHSLSKLLCIMERLAHLKYENTTLRKKCTFLEDTKLLLNEQNKILTHRPGASVGKGESFISKAQSKMMHYLNTPGQGGTHQANYARQHSHNGDVYSGSDKAAQKVTSKSLISRPVLKRSNSMGSVNDLDALPDLAEGIPYPAGSSKVDSKDSHKETTVRQKVNKKLAKLTKMTKVFGRPEQSHKADSAAISVAEFRQVNSKIPVPDNKTSPSSGVAPSTPTTPRSLSIDVSKPEPPSPSTTSKAVPVMSSSTGNLAHSPKAAEQSPEEVKNANFLVDQTALPPKAELEDLASLSDPELDSELTASGSTLVRRNSSPTLSQSLQGSSEYLGGEEPVEVMRRASSFKNRSTRKNTADMSRRISSSVYVQENLLSPEDARLAQQSPRQVDDMHQRAKSAWVKVKDMINTRKDSLKRKPRGRPRSMSFEQRPESSDVSPEGSSWEDRIASSDGDTHWTLTIILIHHACRADTRHGSRASHLASGHQTDSERPASKETRS